MFQAFAPHRGNSIVIITGTGGRRWRDISNNEKRDLSFQGAMGQTTSAALGFALSQPDEKVVLFDSEGALLMNLGVMASIAGKAPANFYHFLLDNECYATTVGQPVPNATGINYAGVAENIGYASAHHFDNLEDLVTGLDAIMSSKGPVFVSIKIKPEVENLPVGMRQNSRRRSRGETIDALGAELGIS